MHEFKGMDKKLNVMIYAALNYEENGVQRLAIYRANAVDLKANNSSSIDPLINRISPSDIKYRQNTLLSTRLGVIFLSNITDNGSDYTVTSIAPWRDGANAIELFRVAKSVMWSFSSDDNGRVYAVLTPNASSSSENDIQFSHSPTMPMHGSNLNHPTMNRVLAGEFGANRKLGFVLWDKFGCNGILLLADEQFDFKKDDNYLRIPNITKKTNCDEVLIPAVTVGDLNQDGLSDIIIAKNDGIKIHYAKVEAGKTSFTEETNYPDALKKATNVEAIAVSIPSGDDPPKLVWATSSFIQDSGKSTGTNTITINVLPIK